MSAADFLNDFMAINRRFEKASRDHLRTPWWRFFKSARHLREMQRATLEMDDLGKRTARGYYAKPR